MIEITPDLSIPDDEVRFAATRSGGPGGQNVNKVATRVTLFFDVDDSPSLSEEQRDRIRARLATRISRSGVLQVTSQIHRSQARNREEALLRFVELLRGAFGEVVERRPTRVPAAARRRRLEEKKRRGRLKRERSARPEPDDG